MHPNLLLSPQRIFDGRTRGISHWFCNIHPQTFLISTSNLGWSHCPDCRPFKSVKTPQLARLIRYKERKNERN
jgi:hypothetical protein